MLRERRIALGILGLSLMNVLLGRALPRRVARPRRLRPDDLAPIPWIGHC